MKDLKYDKLMIQNLVTVSLEEKYLIKINVLPCKNEFLKNAQTQPKMLTSMW